MTAAPPATDRVRLALERGRSHLLGLQQLGGFWRGELQTNVTMDAEDLFLRHVLGISDAAKTQRAAAWIRSQQAPDGAWANYHGGPGNLSTTAEAYAALRLAGDPPGAAHMRRAAGFVTANGGLEQSRVFTRIWLALLGLWRWDDLPTLPVELCLLPSRVPLNPYDFACWARQTIVALTVVFAKRPVHPVSFGLDELHGATGRRDPPSSLAGRALAALERPLRAYDRRPLPPLRRAALGRAERWIVQRQEADGSWGGIQPPWVYSLIALRELGYPLDHPVVRAGIDGIETFVVDDDQGRRLEACQSPVWDTALTVIALTDAGVDPADPALVRAADWLLDHEVTVAGDWAVRRPRLPPGGWAFEFANLNYPDVDDTAEVAMALRRVEHPEPTRVDEAVRRAVTWVLGMQSSDGGWGAFDADNRRGLCRELPFCDFGEVIDPPSADVTAHALEMLAGEGLAEHPATRRGLAWLMREQERDGSWFGRWGVNHVYGTGGALPALAAAGMPPGDARMRSAVRWVLDHQNQDGGWGEDPRSYDDAGWVGRGESTASQTAWALLALHAAGEAEGEAARRGVEWLAENQRPDGGWDEPQFTGTGFPSDYYINYHLYRHTFPVMALGRCLSGAGA